MHVYSCLAVKRDDNAVHRLNVLHVVDIDPYRNAVATQATPYARFNLRGDVFDRNRALTIIRLGSGACALRLGARIQLRVPVRATSGALKTHLTRRWAHRGIAVVVCAGSCGIAVSRRVAARCRVRFAALAI